MPQNKNALIRYQTIDECLRDRTKYWTKEMIHAKVKERLMDKEGIPNVSMRTIQLDLQHLRSDKLGYNAKIEVHKRKYYRYEDPNFKIYDSAPSKDDIKQLTDALAVIEQFLPFKILQDISDDFLKLERTIKKDLGNDEQPIKYIQLDTTQIKDGMKYITPIKNALMSKTCLRINYEPFNKPKAYFKVVSPHVLKEFNNRWFLLCTDMNDDIHLMALDRMNSLEEWLADDYKPYKLNLYNYFDNCIGVSKTIDKKPIHLVFKTTKKQYNYIRTKPLHKSQRELGIQGDWVTVSLDVVDNFELTQKLMTFVPEIEIIEPAYFREKIKEKLKKAYMLY